MSKPILQDDPLLTEKEAARVLGVTPYWFQKVRSQGRDGPIVTRIGGAVRYRLSNLERYIAERSAPTSQPVDHVVRGGRQ